MSLDARLENPGKTPAEPPAEVHTENGIEPVTTGHGWQTWFVLTLIFVAVVLFFVWIGVAGASAPGGCGGG